MYEYLGLYDEDWCQLHITKIQASTKEEAENKFKLYLESKLNSVMLENKMYVIPLFAIEEMI